MTHSLIDLDDALWDRRLADCAATLVEAWSGRLSCEVQLQRHHTRSTDGWAIFDGSDCVVTRLRLAETVAVSGRTYRGPRRRFIDLVERELQSRGVNTARVVTQIAYRPMRAEDLEEAWKIRQTPTIEKLAQCQSLGEELVDAWLAGQSVNWHLHRLEASVYENAIWAVSDCVATSAPGLSNVALVSAKKYRSGGPPIEAHRFDVRREVRRALVDRGLIVSDVTPRPEPGRQVRAHDLLAAWEQVRPRVTVAP